jgi:MFS family permease
MLGAYLVDRRPLRIPAFRRLWTATAVTAVGGSFSLIAVPTQLFTMTGSSAAVGSASAVTLSALIGSALWSGALADAKDRGRLLAAGNAGLGLTCLCLWLHAVFGFDSVPVMLGLVAVQGICFGVTMTAVGAVVPRLVPTDHLIAANSLSSLARYAGAILGPLLAGALIPVIGLGTLYLLDAIAFCVVLRLVVKLPAMPPTSDISSRTGTILRQLGDGFRYLAGHRLLVAILAVDLAAMVFALPFALYPELAERVYGGRAGGGVELGLLFAAYPAGVFLGGLLSGTFSRARRHGALMASAALVWGGCVVALGVSVHLWISVLVLLAGGAVNLVLSTCRNAISQAHTDDALRGRIQGALTVVVFGGPQLANLLHGYGGSLIGARWAIGLGGALTIISVAVLVVAFPELRHYRAAPDVDQSTAESGRTIT